MSNRLLLESPDTLTAVWHQWLRESGRLTVQDQWLLKRSYQDVTRKYGLGLAFENWLFQHGAEVRQLHGERYLHFLDEHRATLFLLRWM